MKTITLALLAITLLVVTTAAVPDGRTAQAMLIQRLSTDLVLEYDAIELVESSEMPAVFDRLNEIEAADESLK